MSFAKRETVALTTDGSGDDTDYTGVVNGRILALIYTKTDFTNGVVFTITTEDTLQNIWVETAVDASKTCAPRQATHSTVGVASVYNDDGDEPVEDYIWAVDERIKIVISAGGATKTGTIDVLIG